MLDLMTSVLRDMCRADGLLHTMRRKTRWAFVVPQQGHLPDIYEGHIARNRWKIIKKDREKDRQREKDREYLQGSPRARQRGRDDRQAVRGTEGAL